MFAFGSWVTWLISSLDKNVKIWAILQNDIFTQDDNFFQTCPFWVKKANLSQQLLDHMIHESTTASKANTDVEHLSKDETLVSKKTCMRRMMIWYPTIASFKKNKTKQFSGTSLRNQNINPLVKDSLATWNLEAGTYKGFTPISKPYSKVQCLHCMNKLLSYIVYYHI